MKPVQDVTDFTHSGYVHCGIPASVERVEYTASETTAVECGTITIKAGGIGGPVSMTCDGVLIPLDGAFRIEVNIDVHGLPTVVIHRYAI